MPDTNEVRQQAARIEELIGKLEESADAGSLTAARELIQTLMDLYGAGFARVAETLARKGAAGREILEELGQDELVGNLLAANGVHPVDLEARVRQAIEKVTNRLRGQASIEVLGIGEGSVRLRLRATAQGCGSSTGTVQGVVEEAIYDAAPDLSQLTIELVEQGAASGFVPLEALSASPAATNGALHRGTRA